MEWFKEELFLMPNWAWFAIIIGAGCILMAIIIVACVRKGDKAKGNADEVTATAGEEPKAEADEVKSAEVKEDAVSAPAEPEVPVEDAVAEKKPAAKKKTAAKKEETAEKPTAAKTAAKTAKAESSADDVRVYHVSRREDKKWEVRIDGGDKALKLFFTQKEAIDYTRKISGRKRILVHKEDGGTREV